MSEIIPQGISLMLYGRVNGHTSRLVEYHETVVLESYWHIETAVGLKETVILQSQHDNVPLLYHIYAADGLASPRYTALLTLQLCEQPP